MKQNLFFKLKKTSVEIRNEFIDFFKRKNHNYFRSSSVVPIDDPTLLFTNAGMNQFKPFFIGIQKSVNSRLVNSQKCIRVSGKHNDLEEVGVDDYHHTFFEMLGNWSFGDYYKKEAITWAWELLTEVWSLDKNRLWVTIYKDDDESGDLWKSCTDIKPNRILKFGDKDNFWEMGETGPCGPCTEIHYYTGENINKQSSKGVNSLADYREIWNLVFIQYNRSNNGVLEDLPEKHVDTGAGFERLVAVLNGYKSNYETDLFVPILDRITEISGKNIDFEGGVAHRVIADHIRMLTFSIADGAMPGNDGRGYVLRRVLRRAARFGRKLEIDKPFIYLLTDVVCEIMGGSYPELIDKKPHILKVIRAEELAFNETLDRGLDEFNKIMNSLKSDDMISGDDAFKLYDTFGFPLDLTELIARENGCTVDIGKFNNCMDKQRQKARESGKFYIQDNANNWVVINKNLVSEFIGYDSFSSSAKIIKYRKINGRYEVILDKTPFYAESGGQVSDVGELSAADFSFLVEDVQNINDEFIHIGTLKCGDFDKVSNLKATIDNDRRLKIRRNHTATHLLHQSLKEVLGNHVQQSGSYVASNLLRFDLTHYEQITNKNIKEIEDKINSIILDNLEVSTDIKDYKLACSEGAVSLFGEKYGDIVRVVNIPGFSMELCGGTHVNSTGEIGCFKIITESALAAGIRRIVAITGNEISDLLTKQEILLRIIKEKLKCSENEVIDRLNTLIDNKKILEKKIKDIEQISIINQIDDLIDNAANFSNYSLVVHKIDRPGDLRKLGDQFRKKFEFKGISLIGTVQNDKPIIMCSVTDDLLIKVKAREIVQEIGSILGGGGGGKSHIATAGGNDIALLDKALSHGEKIIKKIMGNK